LVRPDDQESRRLVKVGDHPSLSPDGYRVVYLRGWNGAIRTMNLDGSSDDLFFQAPALTYVATARWSVVRTESGWRPC
jgi:hypothetical protein